MADEPLNTGSALAGAGIAGVVGLVFAAVRGLFNRNVEANDSRIDELRQDVKEILGKLGDVHGDVSTLKADANNMRERLVNVEREATAAHRRLDDGSRAK